MDRLVVRLPPHEATDLGRWTAVDLLVNGRDLKDLVAEFKRSEGWEPAGGYDSISLDGLQHAQDRLTGEPSSWPGNGEVVLLVCASCREEGCWPLSRASTVAIRGSLPRSASRPSRTQLRTC
jgi:hypothetical protein